MEKSMTETSVNPFQFEGRNVRLIDQDGEMWFVATDVARELGYEAAKDMSRHLDEDEKGRHTVPTVCCPQWLVLNA
jgi:anti-repressor protein